MHTEDDIVEIGARALFGTLVTNVTFEESHGRDELRKQSRAYLAALRQAGLVLEQGWRFDMENAPRDGTHIIAFVPWAVWPKTLFWNRALTAWECPVSGLGPTGEWTPVAWRPLPTPPATGGET